MLSGFRSRIPFGIGTVVMIAIAAMVATAGIILSMEPGASRDRQFGFGQLRSYNTEPVTAWTRGVDDLPEFGAGGSVAVADTHGDTWLLSYPSGLGKAFLAVSRYNGESRWAKPVVTGLGSCAFTSAGQVGCAVKVGNVPDGFYLVDDSGQLGPAQPLEDTGRVLGVGDEFVRVDQVGYHVNAVTAAGVTRWSRTFAYSATPTYIPEVDLIDIALADASHVLVDPDTGKTKLSCGPCSVAVYPSGIAVSHQSDDGVVDFHAFSDGKLVAKRTHTVTKMQVSAGPAVLPVLGGIGLATVGETHGRFEVRDPARAQALWTVNEESLSKARPMACGRLVAFARKNHERTVMRLDAEGTVVGRLPAPDQQRPDTNLAELRCVGSFGDVIVVANDNQVTAFDAATGGIRWEVPVSGSAQNVDGHIVLRQGATISLLR
ncbi:hypothetical protein GOARA_082_00740 [Gordonia araii NBRC 100433]|uniref:Uncharacterized protein n=1 Tax=Gordonia araii NBRC 100433 TaxID=1073574 RepID=G7H760_9ACTN|nr:PQQ-binding-like beta-propeller repeat protein [Gordonia araii]NNG97681.1 PQQ-binding-like beta-propeller repeat protein [Gordonia araii NBRC 100433]GAB11685.1 hypothetical protein GOARA_082_00740 [Gordonia araii NBRC 100433]